jgi:hypothetical protein
MARFSSTAGVTRAGSNLLQLQRLFADVLTDTDSTLESTPAGR